MSTENEAGPRVAAWLRTLGVESLAQWDVLVFLHRHQASLLSAEHVTRLVGHESGPVLAALDALVARGLVTRSRVSGAARLYQFTAPAEPPRGEALGRLLRLAESRAGRLRLTTALRPAGPPVQQSGPARRRRGRGGVAWRKAI